MAMCTENNALNFCMGDLWNTLQVALIMLLVVSLVGANRFNFMGSRLAREQRIALIKLRAALKQAALDLNMHLDTPTFDAYKVVEKYLSEIKEVRDDFPPKFRMQERWFNTDLQEACDFADSPVFPIHEEVEIAIGTRIRMFSHVKSLTDWLRSEINFELRKSWLIAGLILLVLLLFMYLRA